MMRCKNCGSQFASWDGTVTIVNPSPAGPGDGRLKIHELTATFYIACDECSETLRTFTLDELVHLLNTWTQPMAFVEEMKKR